MNFPVRDNKVLLYIYIYIYIIYILYIYIYIYIYIYKIRGEAQAAAKDRTVWRNVVVALCPTGDEEDK